MSDVTPTPGAVIGLKEERRAMREGSVFLEEKTMLLAGEIVRQLRDYEARIARFVDAQHEALELLAAAITEHGLEGLQVYPVGSLDEVEVNIASSYLMGVPLQSAEMVGDALPSAAPVDMSPEAEACRQAYVGLLREAAVLAAISGNLERLFQEYRHSSRRTRALQDVLLPELDHEVKELETRLEEMEREEAIWMRRGGRG